MEIKIPKITEPLDLGGYAPALVGQVIQVWVNPPLEKRRQYWRTSRHVLEISAGRKELQPDKNPKDKEKFTALEKEGTELLGQIDVWLSDVWSQGSEETQVPVETVHQFRIESADTDPRLFGWMVGRSLQMMMEHQGTVKKT